MYVAIGQLATQGALFGILVLLSRAATPHQVGRFALLSSLVSLVAVAWHGGTRYPVIRSLATGGAGGLPLESLYRIKAISAVLAALLTIGLARAALSASIAACLGAGIATGSIVFVDHLDAVRIGLSQRLYAVASVVAAVVAIAAFGRLGTGMSVGLATLAYGAAWFLKLPVYAAALQRGSTTGSERERIGVMRWLRLECLPFYWQSVLTVAITNLPVMFVGALAGVAQAALFEAANKVTVGILMVASAIAFSLLPRMSKLHAAGGYTDFLRALIVAASFVTLIVGAVTTLAADQLLGHMFGGTFLLATDALILLSWYAALTAVFNVVGIALTASGDQRLLAKLATAYAVLVLGGSGIGSIWGARGAALGLLGGALVALAVQVHPICRRVGRGCPLIVVGLVGVGVPSSAAASVLAGPLHGGSLAAVWFLIVLIAARSDCSVDLGQLFRTVYSPSTQERPS